MKKNVIIIDDDLSFLKITKIFLKHHKWTADCFDSWESAKKHYGQDEYTLAMIDLNIGNFNGLQLVEEMKKLNPSQAIIIVTGNSTLESAISALRLGVLDYITKPCENEEILIRLENVFSLLNKDEEIEALKDELADKYKFHHILTQDEQLIKVCELAKAIAPTDSTVLLQGETGTGKEIFSRAIHYESNRKKQPFIVVNCAGINENLLESHLFGHVKGAFTGAHETVKGKFEVVKEGTIFLDEISETSLNFQKKFLRVLEEKSFEKVGASTQVRTKARVIAATNKNLSQLVQQGAFRKDLFFRLNVVPIHIPPLRKRLGDIPILAMHFFERFALKFNKPEVELDAETMEKLMSYNWPGNVRELEHYIEKLVVTSQDGHLRIDLFPLVSMFLTSSDHETCSELDTSNDFDTFRDNAEKVYFKHLMKTYHGNIHKMASHAKTTKKTIYAKIKLFELKSD